MSDVRLSAEERGALKHATFLDAQYNSRASLELTVERILAARLADQDAAGVEARAEGWDEAVKALAWALDNGPSERALPYVAEHNPFRAALSGPADAHPADGAGT